MDEIRSSNTTGRHRRRLRIAAIAMSSAAAVALLTGIHTSTATTTSPVTPIVAAPWSGYADLVEKVMPAVVSVTVERTPAARDGHRPARVRPPAGSGRRDVQALHGALLRRARHGAVPDAPGAADA